MTTNTSNGLVIQGIARQYEPPNGPIVLRDVNLQASAGQTVAIVGPSGCGKSTLLNIIASLDQPTAGMVALNKVQVTSLSPKEAARYRAKSVGLVFQDHHLLPQLTGVENVLLPTLSGGSSEEAIRQCGQLLERLGVAKRAGAFPAELSGGERQRLAIARALINQPGLLLCDEPTGNLDHVNAAAIVDLFVELAQSRHLIVIMVTHNRELAGRFNRQLELSDGRLVELSRPAGVEATP